MKNKRNLRNASFHTEGRGFLIFSFLLLIGLGFNLNTFAYQIESLSKISIEDDIVLGPGKTELLLDPGDRVVKELMITNRTGKTKKFKIDIEDFIGSRDPTIPTVFLGEEGEKKGPYSLKDYLKPEIFEFILEHGQRMILPVEISIPIDAEPGGRYGSVLVKTVPMLAEGKTEKEKAKGQFVLVSRLGTLFFIRVKGAVKEEGFLKDFKIKGGKNFYEKAVITFQLLFENNGTVHLTPYGIIEIRNLLGKKVDEIELQPWFVLPDSLKLREMKWEKKWLCGKYTATAFISRGYKDIRDEYIIDEKYLEFWVIPWKVILAGLVGLFLAILGLRWVATRFEIRRKTDNR